MADSFLSKALGWIKNILKTMGSPLSGFDMQDIKVKSEGDQFSELLQFTNGSLTTISGENIELYVLLKAINVKEVFSPILSALNNLTDAQKALLESTDPSQNSGVTNYVLLDVLLGKDRKDNTLASAQQNGTGLLGTKLVEGNAFSSKDGVAFEGKQWAWITIANKYLKYSLECQAEGYDHGAIENQELSNCSRLISEYLVKVGVIDNADEVQVDSGILTFPLMQLIQQWLIKYYQDAVKKYVDKDAETLDDRTERETGEAAAEVEEDLFDEEGNFGGVENAKHINVTLQKITGTSSFNMTMIRANYDPSLVLSDMEEIIGQPEFIESLPEELTTYSIEVDDDGFDIEPCEECIECSPCESLCEVFKSGIRAYRNLYILHWMSSGNDMMKLHNLSEEMYAELNSEIDTIGELLVEKQGTVPQLDFACDYIPVQKYDFQTGLDQIKSLISMYIDCIDYAYCNQDSDVQSTLDEWLRYWNKQLNYFVKGQEV